MMKYRLLFISVTFLLACNQKNDVKEVEIVKSIGLSIKYAENFNLIETKTGFQLDIIDPNTKEVEESYNLKPNNELKIISLTSTLNGMLSILESTNLLVGISDIDYVYDSKIKKRYNDKKITQHGDESNFSIEKMIEKKADVIMYSGFGDAFPNENKLKRMGIELIPIYDWRENHPLGKAEWIKVIGILVGKEKEANAYFDSICDRYFEIQSYDTKANDRPTILSGNLIGDIWFAPAGDTYAAKLIKDAGGDYRYADQPGTISLEFSMESILKNNENTEIWINPGTDTKAKIDRINPHAKHLKAYDYIYCYSPNLNKYWERGASEPHLVLSDLMHIFHPEIEEIKGYHFYQRITE